MKTIPQHIRNVNCDTDYGNLFNVQHSYILDLPFVRGDNQWEENRIEMVSSLQR